MREREHVSELDQNVEMLKKKKKREIYGPCEPAPRVLPLVIVAQHRAVAFARLQLKEKHLPGFSHDVGSHSTSARSAGSVKEEGGGGVLPSPAPWPSLRPPAPPRPHPSLPSLFPPLEVSPQDLDRKLVLREREKKSKMFCKMKPGFLRVSAHDSGETREKKQAVNPLESTDSACLHSHCRFL